MKKKSLILWFLSILFVELFVICLWSNAQFQQMTYQGVLTDASGKRISGTKTLTFEIYNAETIGTRLWGPETRSYTFTDSGLVNVILGSITPLNLDETQQYWLQIRVESDTLRPRIKLTAVPYSMNSDRLDGFHASSTPTAGYLYPLDGSAKIPNARLYTGSGNGLDADLLDGQHASAFLSIANDYGRSGVAPDLYEGTSTLSSKYVNEGQANSVTTSMIVNGTIQTEDLSPGISIPNAVNSDMVDNIHANTIPEANKLFPLNSQGVFYLEKNTSSNIASAVNTGSGGALWAVSNTGTAINVAGGQSAISAESDNYHTIVAKSNNSSYYSIYGYKNLGGTVIYARANVSTGSGGTAINGYAAGTGGNGVIGECNNGSSAYGIWGISSTGFAGWFDGKVWINGNFTATGTKSSVIQTSQGTKALYAIEGLDVEFYASGSSSLNNGYAQIVFENLFQEAISAEIPIKVIVTPTADCNGIFVENKSHSGFSVKEIMSGTSNASFDWIAIGRRKGYEIRPEVNIQNQEKRMIKELGE